MIYKVNLPKDTFKSEIDWVIAEYAKKYYWAITKPFEDAPIEHVELDEFQTEEGEKKEWNWYLSKIISTVEKGELLDSLIGGDSKYIIEVDGNIAILDDDFVDELGTAVGKEDVTEWYINTMKEKINEEEIKRYVETHTADEIQEKYAVSGYEDDFWEW